MAEFSGSDLHIEVQKRLRATHSEIAKTPALANGGRMLNVIDIDAVGWDQIYAYAERDQIVGLTAVPLTETLNVLRTHFGDGVDFPFWQVFFGTPEPVLAACERIIDAYPIPTGWNLASIECPDMETVQQVQDLNEATGVAPTPAYFMRREVFPSITTCLWDDTGTLAACANATMRYHPAGRMAHHLFAGAVSVHPDHRRKGLGAVINAALLRDSHAAFHWHRVIEQAKADNAASCGMIGKCGLVMDPDVVTIAINLSSSELTR